MSDDPLRIDTIDRRIIAQLVDDARCSYRALGTVVGLSAAAVKRRVDRLRSSGAIERFTVTVDPRVLGWSVEAFIEVFCAPRTAATTVGAMLTTHAEVVAAYTVTGDADALVHLRVADAAHLEHVLERIRDDPVVAQTHSVVVLSRLLDRPSTV